MTQQRWEGGRIHLQKDGRELFTIERRLPGGKRVHISTRCHSRREAMKHLDRFEADPWKYIEEAKHGPVNPDGLLLTSALLLEFRDWLLTRERHPVTRKYANQSAHRLRDWEEDLRGRDLRKLDLASIKAKLTKRGTSRQARIIALKSFMGWLRKEKHVLDRRDDATIDLEVPQGDPEKHKRRKAVELERVRAVVKYLPAEYLDLLALAAGTGWHFTEIERFIRREDTEVVRHGRKAVLVTWHKTRKWTRTTVSDPAVIRAAERLKEKGAVPRRANQALKSACAKAKVERFTFGVMRHTVGTWGVEQGNSPQAVSEFLAHADKSTSERFYIDVAAPSTEIKLPRLKLVR